jgi:hypothetical protein
MASTTASAAPAFFKESFNFSFENGTIMPDAFLIGISIVFLMM